VCGSYLISGRTNCKQNQIRCSFKNLWPRIWYQLHSKIFLLQFWEVSTQDSRIRCWFYCSQVLKFRSPKIQKSPHLNISDSATRNQLENPGIKYSNNSPVDGIQFSLGIGLLIKSTQNGTRRLISVKTSFESRYLRQDCIRNNYSSDSANQKCFQRVLHLSFPVRKLRCSDRQTLRNWYWTQRNYRPNQCYL